MIIKKYCCEFIIHIPIHDITLQVFSLTLIFDYNHSSYSLSVSVAISQLIDLLRWSESLSNVYYIQDNSYFTDMVHSVSAHTVLKIGLKMVH
jgi:hypothetical protein